MVPPKTLDSHSVDSLQTTGTTGLGNELLRWATWRIECLNEPFVVLVDETDRSLLQVLFCATA